MPSIKGEASYPEQTMKTTTWLSEMTVGDAAIDAAHRALFDQMLLLFRASDSELGAGFLSLTDKLESDFREEEKLMEGLDFPGLHSHLEEHAKVLGALNQLDPADAGAVREVLRLMLQWFPAHVATMDSALMVALRRAAVPAAAASPLHGPDAAPADAPAPPA